MEVALEKGEEALINTYGDCVFCGGAVRERVDRLDYSWRGRLFLIDNSPFGQCDQCGERFLTAETTERLERVVANAKAPLTTVPVPVLSA